MAQYAVHITGASGSGVTTLGRALSEATGAIQLDTDAYYWAPAEPKYSTKREPDERVQLLREAMEKADGKGWILSGSIGTWGGTLVPLFNLVVFMSAPTEVRVARLAVREEAEFGAAAIAPGGARHAEYVGFLDWASQYESGAREGRSRRVHEEFLSGLACPVLRLDGTVPTAALVERVVAELKEPR